MQVQFIRTHESCDVEMMMDVLKELGFRMEWNGVTYPPETSIKDIPGEITFVQQYPDQAPAKRLSGTDGNPCADVPPLR